MISLPPPLFVTLKRPCRYFPIQRIGADGEGFFPDGRQIFACCIALIKKITLDFAHGVCKGLRFAQHRAADLTKPACGFINIDPIFPPGADIIRVCDKFLAELVKKILGFGGGIGLVQGSEVRKGFSDLQGIPCPFNV